MTNMFFLKTLFTVAYSMCMGYQPMYFENQECCTPQLLAQTGCKETTETFLRPVNSETITVFRNKLKEQYLQKSIVTPEGHKRKRKCLTCCEIIEKHQEQERWKFGKPSFASRDPSIEQLSDLDD